MVALSDTMGDDRGLLKDAIADLRALLPHLCTRHLPKHATARAVQLGEPLELVPSLCHSISTA